MGQGRIYSGVLSVNPKNRMMELGFPQDQIQAIRGRLSDDILISLFEQLDAMPESKFPFASRFYSLAIKAMGDLPGTSTAQEKIASDAMERQDADRRREIRLILDAEGPSSTQKLHKAIGGRKGGLIAVLNMMVRDAELIVVKGTRGAKVYSLNPGGEL